MYQRVTIVGNLGRDPELRYTADGTPVTNFSVATTDRWKDKSGEPQSSTVWWKVTAWRRTAEIANEFLGKGSLVLIEGVIKADDNGNPNIWTTNDGEARSNFELTANILRMLSRKEAEEEGFGAPAPSTEEEDSIPF